MQLFLRDAKQTEILLSQQESFLSRDEIPVRIYAVFKCFAYYTHKKIANVFYFGVIYKKNNTIYYFCLIYYFFLYLRNFLP